MPDCEHDEKYDLKLRIQTEQVGLVLHLKEAGFLKYVFPESILGLIMHFQSSSLPLPHGERSNKQSK